EWADQPDLHDPAALGLVPLAAAGTARGPAIRHASRGDEHEDGEGSGTPAQPERVDHPTPPWCSAAPGTDPHFIQRRARQRGKTRLEQGERISGFLVRTPPSS